MNLDSLNLEELKELRQRINEEIARKQENEALVLYIHDCKNSAKYHKGKYKHWAKLVKSVDTTKTNGYAFVGDFLNINYEHKIPSGSIVVEVCGNTITAYKVTNQGKEEMDNVNIRSMSNFIDNIAKKIGGIQ